MGVTLSGSQGLSSPQANGYVGDVMIPPKKFMKVAAFGVHAVNFLMLLQRLSPAIIRFLIQEVWSWFQDVAVQSSGIVTTSRYVVPTGRVKVPAGRYVVPTGKDNVIVSAGRSKVIPAGRTILVLEGAPGMSTCQLSHCSGVPERGTCCGGLPIADSELMEVAVFDIHAVTEYAFGFKMLLFNPLAYVVPTGRVKVPAGRYVVPTGKDNVIVSTGRTKVIPADMVKRSEDVKLLIFPCSFLNEELQDIYNKCNELREGNAFKNHLNDGTPMYECHEANYIQSEGNKDQNSRDSHSCQSHYDPIDSEKSLTELNNDVKNDLEDFKRHIHSMRTVHWKLFNRDDGKTTGVLPNKKSKPTN
ncbi:hypothetical protein Tco_0529781 [Tanacetum coccineum]